MSQVHIDYSMASFVSTLPEEQRLSLPTGRRLTREMLGTMGILEKFEAWKLQQKRLFRSHQPRTDEVRESDRIKQAVSRAMRQGLCETKEDAMTFVQPRWRDGTGSIPRVPRYYDEHNENTGIRARLLQKLDNTTFTRSQQERQAISQGTSKVFGKVYSTKLKTYNTSSTTKSLPRLYELLQTLASLEIPQFSYTTIAVNKNVVTRPHVDKYNVGPTLILGLGKFKGGNLVVSGKEFDLSQQKWVYFWGKDEHYNTPLKGKGVKYTVTYFTLLPPYATPTQSTHRLIGSRR